jgi:preprotein translocase SecF subunit
MRRIDLVGARGRFFVGSAIFVVASLVLLAIPPGLRPGIEFTSGTTALIEFERLVAQDALRTVYAELGHPEVRIQSTAPQTYLIRTRELEVPPGGFTEVAPDPGEQLTPIGPRPVDPVGTVALGAEGASGDVRLRLPFQGDPCNFGGVAGTYPAGTRAVVLGELAGCAQGPAYRVAVEEYIGYIRVDDTHDFREPEPEEPAGIAEDQGERTVIERRLLEEFGPFEVLEFASVSAVVSEVAVRNAAIAVAVASLFIMGYVAFAFSSVPRPFRYATCAIVALLHDVVIVLGAFSLFGKLFGIEINLMFVTGLLTVVGFSVHDTIVVFDRIRENVRMAPNSSLAENVNAALLQTMARSLNTSVTVLIVALAMLLLGGVTIQSFLLVILVGVIAGTYSSIGIAAQLLVAWEEGDLRRLRRRLAPSRA